ncbi:Rho GTPase activation protein [Penicillium robsamsonii]|uniref:Rho GTPase activation protein n=1 Tax=Penicillium robsamsonii TaxID=1792511 RepID=UPI0025496164|nr:Rho GTPase activation protein [Penicillium robsamsonii]KAJ5834282.1 Rho GTPase activation protein [Penicillium robsamsonii]
MSQVPRGNDESSPTLSKNQIGHSVNNGLIPRDYLARSDQRPGPTPSSRHITPSPLHTSSLPQSHRVEGSESQSPLSPKSNPSSSQNRSPVTRVANAQYPAAPFSPGQSLSQSPEMVGTESANVSGRPGENSVPKPSRAPEPDRSASSSVSSIHSMPGDRAPHRIIPRTSSIDSAISSLSSNSQRSAFDVNALSSADINNLINAAGSAEAVIVHLLKEKHHAASQNAQLWKLVDKQRTLILGLNKDLERAFQEKDKYRKKLKDMQDTPPLPVAKPMASVTASSSGKENESCKPDQPSIISPSETSQRGLENTTSPVSPTDLPSPVGDGKSRFPHPNRKPPPAPLNLRQADNQRACSASDSDPDSESGSDYGDAQGINGIPSAGRGRRKTREQDDQDREATLQKDMFESTGSVGPNQTASSHSSRDTATCSPETVPRELSTRSPPNVGDSSSLGSLLGSRPPPASSFGGRSVVAMPMSPGLPLSPRPEDRPINSPMPRMPRDASTSMAAGYQGPGLPLSPRMANHPMGFAPIPSGRPSGPIPSIDPTVMIDSPRSATFPDNQIYRGLMSDEYQGLLLPPNALPLVQVRVSSSRLRPSRNSYMASKPLDEEPVFTLSVILRSQMSELWRVEKVIGALPQLDQKVRQSSPFPAKLPDRGIFSGHSPAKIDLRRAALNAYFDGLLDTPMDENAAIAICQFLTSDAIEPRDDETSLLKGLAQTRPDMPRGPDGKPQKEGYLTKRGKNFGGWKARYFVLDGPELRYYESPGGPHMGTIKLHHAQIGKQSPKPETAPPAGGEEDSDNQYRHAFLVLEPKKKDSSALVRHVLCAESDEERDTWVDALMEYVESASSENEGRGSVSSKSQPQSQDESQIQQKQLLSGTESKSKIFNGSKRSGRGVDSPDQDVGGVQGFSFDDAVQADPPTIGSTLEQAPRSPRIPALTTEFRDMATSSPDQPMQSPRLISRPTNGTVIQDVEAWGNKAKTSTKEKKRSIWGFRTRSSFDLATQANSDTLVAGNNVERTGPVRPVFGIPLAEAVQDCGPPGIDVELPAVVYRCIEYLHAKEAALEEGIFRLSGSNVVIKALKERFNTEGDVDFVSGDQYYDIHAVASLFKQYLRELPTTVLTRELHLDFLRVLELDDRQKKVAAFNSLVHRLPRPNLSLLRALSQFLIEIVNNSDVNKMTVRNVGIVFAPTLNIPAPVFSMFLTDYDSIFGDTDSSFAKPTELTVESSLSPDDIRSPRHQMFSDLPTPSYQQTSFRTTGDGNGPPDGPRNHYDTGFTPIQPSYDQPTSSRHEQYNQPPGAGAQYSSLNGMLVPGSEDTRSAKTKRRESSMLFMDGKTQPEDSHSPC